MAKLSGDISIKTSESSFSLPLSSPPLILANCSLEGSQCQQVHRQSCTHTWNQPPDLISFGSYLHSKTSTVTLFPCVRPMVLRREADLVIGSNECTKGSLEVYHWWMTNPHLEQRLLFYLAYSSIYLHPSLLGQYYYQVGRIGQSSPINHDPSMVRSKLFCNSPSHSTNQPNV